MNRTIIMLSLVLMFVTGLMVGYEEGADVPRPQVDSSIPILHYPDCYDIRTPEGWTNHVSIAGGEYVDYPFQVNTILATLCPELYNYERFPEHYPEEVQA